jgi:hypothetical protein
MRMLIVALLALSSACAQPPATPSTSAVSEQGAAMLAALNPVIAAEIGQPVRLESQQMNVQGEWAWVWVQPRQPDGAAIDWSTTALASRYENGVMDAAGGAYALLKQESGAWRVVTHVIAPTDVAWLSWAEEYGAPAEIMGPTD